MTAETEHRKGNPVDQILANITSPPFQRGMWSTDSPVYIGFKNGVVRLDPELQVDLIVKIIGNLSREQPNQKGIPAWDIDAKETAVTATPLIGRKLENPCS